MRKQSGVAYRCVMRLGRPKWLKEERVAHRHRLEAILGYPLVCSLVDNGGVVDLRMIG